MSGITAADGVVYRASSDGVLYALDAASGETVWKRSVAGDESAFDPRPGPDAVFLQEDGELVAVDRADGTVRWRDDGAYRGDPAVGDGAVYCLADRALVALDAATGERRWTAALPAAEATALDVAGRTVYLSVPTDDGSATLAVDAATGCLRGRFQVAARRTTRVATSDETVYVGGLHGDGALYAVARP